MKPCISDRILPILANTAGFSSQYYITGLQASNYNIAFEVNKQLETYMNHIVEHFFSYFFFKLEDNLWILSLKSCGNIPFYL